MNQIFNRNLSEGIKMNRYELINEFRNIGITEGMELEVYSSQYCPSPFC